MKWFIRLFFKTLRAILGPILLFGDWITTPKGMDRPAEQQNLVDTETQNLIMYEFKTCPFCIKTRRAIKRLSLNIERRDTQHNPEYRQELLEGGGKIKVPCLRIVDDKGADTWMYESDDIIHYLQERFA
jgi:glutaredoxin